MDRFTLVDTNGVTHTLQLCPNCGCLCGTDEADKHIDLCSLLAWSRLGR